MARTVQGPTIDETAQTHPISKGGTSSLTTATAAKKLNLATMSMIGQPEGLIALDASGKIPISMFPVDNRVNLQGPLIALSQQTIVFEITDYDSFKTYNVSVTAGTAVRAGSQITVTTPNSLGNMDLVVNGKTYTIAVQLATPQKPSILTPVNNSTILTPTYALSSSGFSAFGDGSTHQSSDWQIATGSDFSTIVSSVTDSTTNKTTYTVTGLVDGSGYYARVRYKGSNGNSSEWSDPVVFVLNIPTPATPTLTSPTAGQTGVSLTPNLTSSAFGTLGDGSSHASSDWQISSSAAFTDTVTGTTANTGSKVNWVSGSLAINTTYHARVRHRSSNGKISAWSPGVSFVTLNAFVSNVTIGSDTNRVNMRTLANNSGWNGTIPLRLTVTVNSGVVVGSDTTGAAAFFTDSGFPSGSQLSLVNNGYIVGAGGEGGRGGGDNNGGAGGTGGGAGGQALNAQYPISVTNNGVMGGGGGGGGGAGPFVYPYYYYGGGNNPQLQTGYRGNCGGGGGGGAGRFAGSPGRDGDGDGNWDDVNGGNTFTAGGGSLTGGGGGGAGQYNNYGGAGGGLGQPGSPSNAGYKPEVPSSEDSAGSGAGGPSAVNPGGAAGACVAGIGNVTWLATGTRLGPFI